ncbi:hypothetical protein Pfo_029452 [Paulownia fortunei]|nr:hypothetical protein Pfo_029452 [Paulownia fortunei]
MQSAKEKAANVAASAKAGMEKTKATMQEKTEKMTTRDPLQKEMATEKKEERIHEAELQKQDARGHKAATRQAGSAGGTFGHDCTTTGGYGADREVRQDYPQGLAGRSGYPGGTAVDESDRVRPEDPNVAGGARTGYGSGNTF